MKVLGGDPSARLFHRLDFGTGTEGPFFFNIIDGQDHIADAEALGFPRLAESVVPLDLRVILFRVVEDPFSDHGADGIQVGVESNGLPLHSLGVGVVHGVLEGGLAVVVFVDGAAGVLCFWCGSAF